MITLPENTIVWKHCSICGQHYKVVKDLNRHGVYRYSSTRGCLVCTYRDAKVIHYKSLLRAFELEDEKEFLQSLKTSMWYMYRGLGMVAAEDVFYRAIAAYWRSKQE
jgi:hypothetical protein